MALEAGWQRYKVAFQYVGTPYSGWQGNPLAPKPSVQDVVEAAVRALVGEGNCSPCQDVGAEALEPHPPEIVRRALNARLRGMQVRVLQVDAVDAADFHARFSARERKYVYRLVTGRSALEAGRAWCVGHPLDVMRMQEAAAALVGQHDFSSFRGRDCQAKSPVKTLREVRIARAAPDLLHPVDSYGELLHVHVRAESFLYHMVRNIVGALHTIGAGRLPVGAMREILEAKDRRAAPEMAPAEGLYLQDVLYEEDLTEEDKRVYGGRDEQKM